MATPTEMLIVLLAFGLVGVYLAFARMLIRSGEQAAESQVERRLSPATRANSPTPASANLAHSR